jgi:hypothetical protein
MKQGDAAERTSGAGPARGQTSRGGAAGAARGRARGGQLSDVPTCLECGSEQWVVRVAQAYREGISVTNVEGLAVGPTGAVPVHGRAVSRSGLARALAPPQRLMSLAVPAVAGGTSALFLAVLLSMGDMTGHWPGIAMLLGTSALSARLVWVRHRMLVSVGTAVELARRLWHQCWLCRRCCSVSLIAAETSRVLPVAGLAASLVRCARHAS